jgi:hypothetical protein
MCVPTLANCSIDLTDGKAGAKQEGIKIWTVSAFGSAGNQAQLASSGTARLCTINIRLDA